MSPNVSFRSRLLLVLLLVITVSIVLPTLYYQYVIGEELKAEREENSRAALSFISHFMEESVTFVDEEQLDGWLTRVGEKLGVRLTFIADDGRVLADSYVPYGSVERMDNHAERPEVREALEKGAGISERYSSTIRDHFIYAATTISPKPPLPSGVLRVATEFSETLNRKDKIVGNLILGVVVTLLLAAPLAYYLVRQLGNSIRGMCLVAEAIGHGDYSRRILDYPGKEFTPLTQSINYMAESIQKHVQTIMAQKGQLEAVLDGMKEGVLVLDEGGRILNTNRAMIEIFPAVVGSTGRKPIEVIMDATLQKGLDKAIESKKNGKPVTFQIEPTQGNVYDVSVVPLKEKKIDVGAVAVFHDVSKITHLERVRRDFVANVSHELRTPLTSIKGYAETLIGADKSNEEAMNRFLEVILKNANHMTKIVSDLLSLSRLEAGQQSMEFTNVEVISAFNSAMRECHHLAESRNITVINDIKNDTPQVTADFDRLVQVYRNLLENAIRYSAEGTTIRVFSRVDGEKVVIGVSDQGPGIPRDEQRRIFERFYRVEKHRNRAPGSSGLGLAIVRHIIDRHKGEIWVQSPGVDQTDGATFFFSVPKSKRNTNVTLASDKEQPDDGQTDS